MANNDLAMQFLADQLGLKVQRPRSTETTALGAAFMAGIGAGVFTSLRDIERIWECDRIYNPKMAKDQSNLYMEGGNRPFARPCRTAKVILGLRLYP